MSEDPTFKPFYDEYQTRLNKILLKYKENFTSNKVKEIRLCLELRSKLKYMDLLFKLNQGPQELEGLLDFVENGTLKDLIENDFVMQIATKTATYLVLLTDIKVKKFTPKYLVNLLSNKLKKTEITAEMAMKHLEFLDISEKTI